jgi:hypothetical protein
VGLVRARYAFVALAALTLVMAGVAVLYSVHYANALQASQQHQAAQTAAAQRAQSAAFERKLCATLDRLASRKPPAGSPADLSRAYLLWQWSQLAELGPDVGCGR